MSFRRMERASRLLSSLKLKAVENAGVRVYHLAPGAWAAAVGKKIAKHAKPTWFDNGRLTVEVQDAVWQAQLNSLLGQIMARLEKIAGAGMIRSIEFRVVPARRAPQRVESVQQAFGPGGADDAEEIEDPVMRRLYRQARRKATG